MRLTKIRAQMVLLLSAILPVAIILYFIYRNDIKKEPWQLLLKCFGFGMFSIIPTIIIEMILNLGNVFHSSFVHSFYTAFIVAGFTEELLKFLILYWIIFKSKRFDQYYDGIVYAVFVSLGFAFVENIIYVLQGGIGTAVGRAILSVPAHGLFGVIMGYFLSLAKFSDVEKIKHKLFPAFLLPMLFHGVFDFILMYGSTTQSPTIILLLFVSFVLLMILLWKFAIRKIKNDIAIDKNNSKEENTVINS